MSIPPEPRSIPEILAAEATKPKTTGLVVGIVLAGVGALVFLLVALFGVLVAAVEPDPTGGIVTIVVGAVLFLACYVLGPVLAARRRRILQAWREAQPGYVAPKLTPISRRGTIMVAAFFAFGTLLALAFTGFGLWATAQQGSGGEVALILGPALFLLNATVLLSAVHSLGRLRGREESAG
ncbi:hypothetical protein [Protaetiibacter intestinalis]|uniref:Uncharacterized protein n=1 Tax=Protaetiibacter intestinalis TaxID=2419774 RepID=A0A387B740_9MICO|nr:hypothetical protein [Protaetiibacter intestinalis]AYF96929.1 hypothetical protein D7I47_00770 [Protaetiibacter intestinalis]